MCLYSSVVRAIWKQYVTLKLFLLATGVFEPHGLAAEPRPAFPEAAGRTRMSMAGSDPTDARPPAAPDAPVPRPAPRRRRWHARLGIQSKLLIMMLVVGVLSTLTIGFLGYRSGSSALRSSVFDRLTALRESRKGQIERYFAALGNELVVLGADLTVVDAMRSFTRDFGALDATTLAPQQLAQLQSFYQQDFGALLDKNAAGTPAVVSYEPRSNAQRYLQYHYTIASTNTAVTVAVDDANDGSRWSSAHRRFHPFFRSLASRLEFQDVLLIDIDGDIVYTVSKSIDLGTNLQRGFFAATELGKAFERVLASGNVDFAMFVDYQDYLPSFGAPTAFVLTPVHNYSELLGVAAVKLPAEAVNRIMTDAGNWATDGLGLTGETYLAGSDYLMRSQSRFLLEDPAAFGQQVRRAGTSEPTVERMLRLGTTILQQPVRSPSVEAAVRGETGTFVTDDYRDIAVLTSYAPVELPDLNWVIVSKIDAREAFAPEQAFARLLLLSTAGIVVVVSTASLAFAQVFAQPIRNLAASARRVSAGDTSAGVIIDSGDELGELAVAFDGLRSTLRERDEQLARHDEETQRLLLNIMPEPVARRYLNGEASIAQDYQNVAVLAAELDGWNMLAAGMEASRSSALLNELVRAAEAAAEQHGVEKTRLIGSSYLATSGMLVPRVDYARRAVSLACELRDIVDRFNSRNKTSLRLRVGIDAGNVTSALIGSTSITYDIWGDPVEIARRLAARVDGEGILVSERVYRRLAEIDTFEAAGTLDTPGGAQPVWAVVDEQENNQDVPSGQLRG